MADMISVPLKKPTDVDIIQPLKNVINNVYGRNSTQQVQDFTDQINEFSKLRNSAVWKSYEKYESSLEVIYSYFDQIVALETKIPAADLQIPFKWKDAFSKGSGLFGGKTSLTVSQIGYERVCVLFNIAALQSSVASAQSRDSEEGLKLAAKLFQQSAGIFAHLKGTVMAAIQQDPTADLNPETLGALSSLMVAQAQEIFVHKASHDNMKETIRARVANQAEELYADALKQMQKEFVRPLWDKEWVPLVAGKQALFHGMAEFYQSLVCKSNKAVGEEIARLTCALEYLKSAQERSGKPNLAVDLIAKAQKNLSDAIKDNDFIYHERIPDAKTLEPIGRAPLAKPTPLSPKFSSNFKDLFEDLVPMAVHQAIVSFENRKTELVNTEVGKLRDATQLLNSVLASLNLPAALEDRTGMDLPQSLVAKSATVQETGGVDMIISMMQELPIHYGRNREILNETQKMLIEEEETDNQMRERFKEKWKRIPSSKLTESFKANLQQFQQALMNAEIADKAVTSKYDTHMENINLLSLGPNKMYSSVPHAKNSKINTNTSSVSKLKMLMEQVEIMKAERDAIECELTSATIDMKEKFLNALKDESINEHALSVESLGRSYGPLQQQVRESLAKQENLLAEIQKANTEFVAECEGKGQASKQREAALKSLAVAFDTYMEIVNNLTEGTKFYTDLTQCLVALQNRVQDFCFARTTEKEELLKDMTRGLSAAAPVSTPLLPQHHGGLSGVTSAVLTGVLQTGLNTLSSYLQGGGGKTDPKTEEASKKTNETGEKREPPPRPPPPSSSTSSSLITYAGSSSSGSTDLPYPMQPQNMPQPYAQAPSVPYPYTVPMPGSYYTLPFPPGYQPGLQQFPGYPPARYPPQPPPGPHQGQPQW